MELHLSTVIYCVVKTSKVSFVWDPMTSGAAFSIPGKHIELMWSTELRDDSWLRRRCERYRGALPDKSDCTPVSLQTILTVAPCTKRSYRYEISYMSCRAGDMGWDVTATILKFG